ncbi:cryptochrome/DNA photolyase family protein [Aureliella helgolandensis]|uniref:Deoxyribodipyrimidine photo-lyase n=1 Tax=Aureliella helgolandensis TaxID=2527968 RepID=A0A518G0U0_9BACT|nr:deoxyribodipyrimidine photolyase [Aureliella helgolandensis]QDV22150.1 Deoxyribodipyrimidine photo-lyase [Aureliella helgolandensis]
MDILDSINTDVPADRLRSVNSLAINQSGDWVVYWMTAFRRTRSNFALQYARDCAQALGKPLVILEALRVRYRWASDRFHRFVIEGMRDNEQACRSAGALYYPYVEPRPGAGAGLLAELAKRSCLVVSDDFPCFFHPHLYAKLARTLPARLQLVDSNCLMPLAVPERTFTVAHSYRRFMQKELPKHLESFPEQQPLRASATRSLPLLKALPTSLRETWPRAELEELLNDDGLAALPIDHAVEPTSVAGGATAAGQTLRRFIRSRLANYADARNEPDEDGSSELSSYLHFGQLSAHEVFGQVMETEGWQPGKIQPPNGKVNGFWGVSTGLEAFMDQLCTWREIGFNMCRRESNYADFESLPTWAQATLQEHASDKRPFEYSGRQFELAETHDPIWNAAQRQLVREGRIHNYLRMLWGKKILHWTRSPEQALEIMLELNNKYALDGRDPNSYSGIFWVLGRYDRAWGPERPIFGKVRYMTSENTARKHHLKQYLLRFAES